MLPHLTSTLHSTGFGGSGSQVDSARMNLASSFVNGFVNAAFGQDKLLTDDGNKWLYKNKDHGEGTQWCTALLVPDVSLCFCRLIHLEKLLNCTFIFLCFVEIIFKSLKVLSWSAGMLSAAASLGMILLWDVDGGLTQIDKYLYSSEDYIKVNFQSN